MKTANISPIYGYGWTKNKAAIDLPSPFNVEVLRVVPSDTGRSNAIIVGHVAESSHSFCGMWLLLSIRNSGPDPYYNVFLYEAEPPFTQSGRVSVLDGHYEISGYAIVALG